MLQEDRVELVLEHGSFVVYNVIWMILYNLDKTNINYMRMKLHAV